MITLPDPAARRLDERCDTALPNKTDYVGIQYLRAVAALMVVIFHTGSQIMRAGKSFHGLEWLSSGVEIFFVISGFIMWVSTASSREASPFDFWRRRIKRIVPLYWLLTSLLLIVLIIMPSAIKSGQLDPWHVVSSFLFIPAVHPVTGGMQPILIPGWSLNYEMFFYLIFGFTLFVKPNHRIPLLIGIIAVLILVGAVYRPTNRIALFYTAPFMAEFAGGVLLGWLALREISVSRTAAIVLIVVGSVMLPPSTLLDRVGFAGFTTIFASILIASGVVFLDKSGAIPTFKFLRFLGDASYSTYLAHGAALSAYGQLWLHYHLFESSFSIPLYVLSALFVAQASGVILHLLLERRILARQSPSGGR